MPSLSDLMGYGSSSVLPEPPPPPPGPSLLDQLAGWAQQRVQQAGQMTQGPFHQPGGIDQAAGGATGLLGAMVMPEDVAGPLGRGLSRLLNADPAAMTPSELNKTREALQAESSRIADEMIAAGRGHETPSITATLTDPLAARYNAVMRAVRGLGTERALRYGPGAPVTLPPGFKARRVVP